MNNMCTHIASDIVNNISTILAVITSQFQRIFFQNFSLHKIKCFDTFVEIILIKFFSWLVHFFFYVFMSLSLCVCACIETSGINVVFIIRSPPYFWKKVFHWIHGILIWLNYLSSKPQEHYNVTFLESLGAYHCSQIFIGMLVFQI